MYRGVPPDLSLIPILLCTDYDRTHFAPAEVQRRHFRRAASIARLSSFVTLILVISAAVNRFAAGSSEEIPLAVVPTLSFRAQGLRADPSRRRVRQRWR